MAKLKYYEAEASQGRLAQHRTRARKATDNALRHGLTTVRRNNSVYYSDLIELADALVQGERHPEIYEAALDMAHSQIILREARRYQNFLIYRLSDPGNFPTTQPYAELRYGTRMGREKYALYDKAMLQVPANKSSPRSPEFESLVKKILELPRQRKPETALVMALPDLIRIARYERRAWRMWNRAFERFSNAQRRQLRRPT